jgi:hypothetical protein
MELAELIDLSCGIPRFGLPEELNREPTNGRQEAEKILLDAADCMAQRARQRDHEDGERSMWRTVETFNRLTDHRLTERDGWVFMAVLKLARAQEGAFLRDDYVDGAAYIALAGEAGEPK